MRVLFAYLIWVAFTVSAWGQNISISSFDSKPLDKSKKVSHIIYEIQDLHKSLALSAEDLWNNYNAKVSADSIQVLIILAEEITNRTYNDLEKLGRNTKKHR